VRQCVRPFELPAHEAGVSLAIDTPRELGFVLADTAKLERSLGNIIHNAIKFTPRGGSITVTVDKRGQHERPFRIRVTDTGIGIGPQHIDHVMERYYRVGEHVAGTGLGLALCKDVVELHGGRVEISSPSPGRATGTQVCISLPPGPSPTLLLIMPAGPTRHLIEKRLTEDHYRVTASPASEDLLAGMGQKGPEAMVLDASGEETSVLDLLGRLRNEVDSSPAVLILANEHPSIVLTEVARGLDTPLIPRPWDAEVISQTVSDLLLGGPESTPSPTNAKARKAGG